MVYKYPRTYHLPYSPGLQNDDRRHEGISFFDNKEIIATEKFDGENTTLYRNHIHARSVDTTDHPSRAWVKALHGRVATDIPDGFRVCGENLYAEHSIRYDHLPSYFLVFSIWDDTNRCLSWEDTVAYSELMGLKTVPLFYSGVWCREFVDKAFEDHCKQSKDPVEGYVIRLTSSFHYDDFSESTAKWVRKNHVQTDEHWLSRPVKPNGVANGQAAA